MWPLLISINDQKEFRCSIDINHLNKMLLDDLLDHGLLTKCVKDRCLKQMNKTLINDIMNNTYLSKSCKDKFNAEFIEYPCSVGITLKEKKCNTK